jgi:hypothetical protein
MHAGAPNVWRDDGGNHPAILAVNKDEPATADQTKQEVPYIIVVVKRSLPKFEDRRL